MVQQHFEKSPVQVEVFFLFLHEFLWNFVTKIIRRQFNMIEYGELI